MKIGIFATSIFEDPGIRLAERHLVVVKSGSHHEAVSNSRVCHTCKVATPGALDLDFTRLPYALRTGDFYPLVDARPVASSIDLA